MANVAKKAPLSTRLYGIVTCLGLGLGLGLGWSLNASADPLTITVTHLRSTDGIVWLNLCQADEYARALNDRAPCRLSFQFEPSGSSASVNVNVPPGRYSGLLLHDENGNGTLEMKGILPDEGVGFSGNPHLVFGPPNFQTTSFDLSGPSQLTIQTKYF